MKGAIGSLRARLRAFLDQNGIDTAVLVMRDPDSDESVTHVRGDRLWLIGALEAQKHEIVLGWANPPKDQ